MRKSAGKVPSLNLPDTDEVLTDILQSPSPSSRVRKQFLDSVKKEYDSSSSRHYSEAGVLCLQKHRRTLVKEYSNIFPKAKPESAHLTVRPKNPIELYN